MGIIQSETKAPPLCAGDTLDWDEFARRWEATPEIQFAELIGGKAYILSPISQPHGKFTGLILRWVFHYADHTTGVEGYPDLTVRMLGDGPLPDAMLRIADACHGKSRMAGAYLEGAPEFLVEVCVSSAAYDLHEKKELYRRAGVSEYAAVLLHEQEVRWHRLEGDAYVLLKEENGVIRSKEFPGLWLNTRALLKADLTGMIATLEAGLATSEHSRFVEELATRAAK